MNKDEFEVYRLLSQRQYTQRELSRITGFSLGKVNQIMKKINLNQDISNFLVKNAIILAAGFGLRMIPINQTPKALLSIRNEILIERLIIQLREKGIKEIYVVIGFMKEKFEYLIDKFNVNLVVNREYYKDYNSKSLFLTSKYIGNTYIVPADLYFYKNPFNQLENNSWYMLSREQNNKGYYNVDTKGNLIKGKNIFLNAVGLAYINQTNANKILTNLYEISKTDYTFWEDAFIEDISIKMPVKLIDPNLYVEINTYEQLRKLDNESKDLNNEHIEVIKKCFNVDQTKIRNVTTLKKGMTNRSFLFEVNQIKYIMRIPGEGTDKLINRYQENQVYLKVNALKFSDEIVYFNPKNGVKITKFINQARVCDPYSISDVTQCVLFLKSFHEKKIVVGHSFDLFAQIEYYESLFEHKSYFMDYAQTKNNIFKLKGIIDKFNEPHYLTHIDAVPDNFLIDAQNNIKLIDWEYAGMQDVHVDLSMFSIYAGYNQEWIDKIIDIYFCGKCPERTRYKIYSYIAICGLLWSNWCEYKRTLGVEFGEYALSQYRYAKNYSRIALDYFEEK